MLLPVGNERLLHVGEADRGVRLDAFVAASLGIGRRAAARVASDVRVNGLRGPKGRVLAPGDEVRIPEVAAQTDAGGPSPDVVDSLEELLVLAKPPGLPTVAVAGRAGPSVADWLARNHPECANVGQPGESGLVHRLDTGTSGLILAARTAKVYDALRGQFQRHTVEKAYLAVVAGAVSEPIEIRAPIGQHKKSRTRVRALEDGDHPRYAVTPASTSVRPLETIGSFTLVEARTRTGARHQVRVHLAHVGHPLAGDVQYGGPPCDAIDGYLLHASEMAWHETTAAERRTAALDSPGHWKGILSALAASG